MIDTPSLRALVKLALEEDLSSGDITSELTIPEGLKSSATIIAKENLVVCGLGIIPIVIEEMQAKAEVSLKKKDGEAAVPGDVLATLEGSVRTLLSAERTILNFLQRLCGIATMTREVVLPLDSLVVLDTRKTTPGWRAIEKYAVRIGGARNHRVSLGDMILIKNNHIDANGSDIEGLMKRVAASKPPYMPVEIEVRSMEELEKALRTNPDIVMLDNMTNTQISEALAYVKKTSPAVKVEISGGITAQRLKELESIGVEYVSMGALTTKAVNADISMRIK